MLIKLLKTITLTLLLTITAHSVTLLEWNNCHG